MKNLHSCVCQTFPFCYLSVPFFNSNTRLSTLLTQVCRRNQIFSETLLVRWLVNFAQSHFTSRSLLGNSELLERQQAEIIVKPRILYFLKQSAKPTRYIIIISLFTLSWSVRKKLRHVASCSMESLVCKILRQAHLHWMERTECPSYGIGFYYASIDFWMMSCSFQYLSLCMWIILTLKLKNGYEKSL
jgi:hypothetical protein